MFQSDRNPPDVMRPKTALHRADRVGFIASFLCALHCAALPVVIALLPALGLAGALSQHLEEWFAVFVTALGLVALVTGYRRHGAVHALILLVPGLAMIWAGVLYPPLHQTVVPHAVIMTLGGFLVAGAHLANMRLMREHVAGEACDATCAH